MPCIVRLLLSCLLFRPKLKVEFFVQEQAEGEKAQREKH